MTGLTAGPWKGRTSQLDPTSWTLTLDEVRALLAAIPDRGAMLAALGVERLSDRKADRALQLLRRARLIRFTNHAWTRTDRGDTELSRWLGRADERGA